LGTEEKNTPAVDRLRDFSADLCALELMGAYFMAFAGCSLFVLGGKQSINLYANGSTSKCIHKMNNLFAFHELGEI
jgi:hypothetical protein